MMLEPGGSSEPGKTARKMHVGPIHSPVAGRTDHLPMEVPDGSYVLPADSVSALGEGNSMAGFRVVRRMFAGAPRHAETHSGPPCKIVAAGGEYVLSPAEVMHAGSGDLETGHQVLDRFVTQLRAQTVKTLKALPGPRKN